MKTIGLAMIIFVFAAGSAQGQPATFDLTPALNIIWYFILPGVLLIGIGRLLFRWVVREFKKWKKI